MVRLEAMTPMQLDALREMGGIGAGNAITVFSELADHVVRLDLPRVEVVAADQIPGLFGESDRGVFVAHANLEGDVCGAILVMTDEPTRILSIRMLRRVWSDDASDDEMLRRASAAVMSAYLNAVSQLTGVFASISAPTLVSDMSGALLQSAILDVDAEADSVFLVRTKFVADRRSIDALMYFVPDPESLALLLSRLGVA